MSFGRSKPFGLWTEAVIRTTLMTRKIITTVRSESQIFSCTKDKNFAIVKDAKTSASLAKAQATGAAVRSEVTRMAKKYDDVVIDVGGRDTAGQRAALAVADTYVIPFLLGSFDVWTLESVGKLVEEARAFNENLKAVCVINRADAKGSDNEEAASISKETPGLEFINAPMGNRKAFRSAAANGLAVTEVKPFGHKAIAEIKKLCKLLFDV